MYLYIYSINQLQFIGHLKLCIFIGRKKKKFIQSTNRALFNLIIILPLLNLTYAFGEQDNESPAWSCWAVGQCVCVCVCVCVYIYIYIYMYVLGWCTLPILSCWATDRYAIIVSLFESHWYTNLSLTRILTVNILLRALKSFNTIYNSLYIYICMQIEHFHIYEIFLCKFVS